MLFGGKGRATRGRCLSKVAPPLLLFLASLLFCLLIAEEEIPEGCLPGPAQRFGTKSNLNTYTAVTELIGSKDVNVLLGHLFLVHFLKRSIYTVLGLWNHRKESSYESGKSDLAFFSCSG